MLSKNAVLVRTIDRIAESDPAILVQEMARQLRDAFRTGAQGTTAPVSTRS